MEEAARLASEIVKKTPDDYTANVDPAGVTSLEDSNDWPVLMRLKSGEKVVREIALASLVKTGLSDFRPRIAQADKIVIRDGNVNWDKPTDKDPVLATITDPKEIAAFNRMFVFVEKSDKEEWNPRTDIGLGCGCPGGPGIDWCADGCRNGRKCSQACSLRLSSLTVRHCQFPDFPAKNIIDGKQKNAKL